jgi:beta-lactamase class A
MRVGTFVILIGIFGFFIGGLAMGMYNLLACQAYEYINHDFACGSKHAIDKSDYVPLKNNVVTLIASYKTVGSISRASVYFRDLRAGPSWGIDEAVSFAPASLLKLPAAMAYFNYEEEFPGTLKEKILYSPDQVSYLQDALHQIDAPRPPLTVGQYYTIEELLRYSLSYSDNLAFFLTLDYMNKNIPNGGARLLQIFHELGILDPRDLAQETISVRNYAGLYRQLYNVSFLSPTHSETVLSWLSESVYTKGLKAGVPASVKVAHKFGERVLPDGSKQLHDCGIVYFPKNPYLLCVMTEGSDWEKMADLLRAISQMVYEEVDSRKL